MKAYIHFFKIPFLLLGILAIAAIVSRLAAPERPTAYERNNAQCLTTERVFDYADKLTDAEEEMLRELIAGAEPDTGCDIVIVTLEESLEEYAASFEDTLGYLQPYQYTMVYADNFYDENQFGYDRPIGDGVLLLDNWYREWDGGVYSWMSTTGKAADYYSTGMVEDLLSDVLDVVEEDPARAYADFVRYVQSDLGISGRSKAAIPSYIFPALSAVAAVIFFFVNYGGRKGRKMVQANTYVSGGRANFRVKEDRFINKTVTRHKIQKSSGSGGRGGGVSRGGGGHRR